MSRAKPPQVQITLRFRKATGRLDQRPYELVKLTNAITVDIATTELRVGDSMSELEAKAMLTKPLYAVTVVGA